MARDRLAALRAQAQQQVGYSDRWSYPTLQPAVVVPDPARPANAYVLSERLFRPQEGANARWSYPARARKDAPEQDYFPYPYTQSHDDEYGIPLISHKYSSSVGTFDSLDDMSAFYDEISAIQDGLKTFNDNVSRISDLHSRSLNSMDWATSRRSTHQLEGLAKETSDLSNRLSTRIKKLHTQKVGGRNGDIRRQQTALIKHKFVEAIQTYQQVEQAYRIKYKQRMERQLRVVKPDVTPEEVKAVVNDEQGGQLFTEMLQSSNRYGESRAAFREVKERHDDVKKIERTLGELAQLFNDMEILVMQSGETIDEVHAMAIDIEKHTQTGLRQTQLAVDSARAARRKQWICVGIVVIILACFGIAIGVLAAELSNGNN